MPQCYLDCSLYMYLGMLHYNVTSTLWLCIYPVQHLWFPSCSRLFRSVYIVLIYNCTSVFCFFSANLVCNASSLLVRLFVVIHSSWYWIPYAFFIVHLQLQYWCFSAWFYILFAWLLLNYSWICLCIFTSIDKKPKWGFRAQIKFNDTIFCLGVRWLIF